MFKVYNCRVNRSRREIHTKPRVRESVEMKRFNKLRETKDLYLKSCSVFQNFFLKSYFARKLVFLRASLVLKFIESIKELSSGQQSNKLYFTLKSF